MNPGPAKNGEPKMSFGKRQPTSGRKVAEYVVPISNGRNAVAKLSVATATSASMANAA